MNRFGIETNPSCIFRLCFHMNELNGTCTELPAQRHSYVIYREYSSFWQGSNQASWTIGAHFVMSRNRLCVLGPQSWVHIRSTLVPLVCNKKHQSSPPPSLGIPRAPALGEHGIPLPADSVELLAIRPLGGSFARARAHAPRPWGGPPIRGSFGIRRGRKQKKGSVQQLQTPPKDVPSKLGGVDLDSSFLVDCVSFCGCCFQCIWLSGC